MVLPIPPLTLSGVAGDWIGLPNQSGQGGAAGWPRRVGSRAQPGHLGAPGQWVGPATFLGPAPGSRPPSDLHRTQCVCSVGYPWPSPAGWVWESEVCAWSSGDRAPALRSPALPAWPSAPVRTRQGQLREPGECGASSPQGAYVLWPGARSRAQGIRDPCPPASPQKPECGWFLPLRKHLFDGEAV